MKIFLGSKLKFEPNNDKVEQTNRQKQYGNEFAGQIRAIKIPLRKTMRKPLKHGA